MCQARVACRSTGWAHGKKSTPTYVKRIRSRDSRLGQCTSARLRKIGEERSTCALPIPAGLGRMSCAELTRCEVGGGVPTPIHLLAARGPTCIGEMAGVCLWGTMCVTDDAWWSGVLHRLEHLSHPSGRELCFRMREVPDLGIARIPSANGIGGPVEAVGDGWPRPTRLEDLVDR